MTFRRVLLALMLITLPLGACSRRQPPATQPDAAADTAGMGARRAADLERLRQDSIARARASAEADAARRAEEAVARARAILEYNLALGMRRAGAVRDYLAGFGIDANRFEITSMGEDMPLDRRSNEQAWALNRRAEFAVTAGGATLVLPGS
jgi:hypothetical protein